MISLENKRLWLWISLVLTLSFIAFGCVFIICSSILVSRVKQFPPIETSVSTTCTVMDPNINCQVQQVEDLLHQLDSAHVEQEASNGNLLDLTQPWSTSMMETSMRIDPVSTKPSLIHKISSQLNSKHASFLDDHHINKAKTTTTTPFTLLSDLTKERTTSVQGKCFALVQYDTKNMDKEFSKLESVTYFPHSSSSPQAQYTKGQTVNCYFDEFRPQIISYEKTRQPMEYVKFYDIMQIGYVELASAGCLFLFAIFCLGISCCCSYLYNRSLREYAGLKPSSGSLP
ncbi:hypothetical protein FDP41_011108 [Naegleria fowleri]|uniref:Uncharacterized protein n=1 Tax=Naegleria fowleri TaxID=5763 RepID=A0A6A5CBY3_NAEFO|nr:uncharacterized protein FDP41_011108 [Naegleria fowleri]KAF0983130.1 hypothetical protein FDP41_011108 [Naegleria fowleri]CAG4712405.1 unnamed protein product [Naegleria fowleri]